MFYSFTEILKYVLSNYKDVYDYIHCVCAQKPPTIAQSQISIEGVVVSVCVCVCACVFP